MKTCEKAAVATAPKEGEGDRLSEHNFQLMRWLLDHELRGAERYRRYISLMLVSPMQATFVLKEILSRTKRECDKLFELDHGLALLMSDTDLTGALVAVNRYKSLMGSDIDLRFAVVCFPIDGVNCADLLGKAFRRLNAARMLEAGAVVSNG